MSEGSLGLALTGVVAWTGILGATGPRHTLFRLATEAVATHAVLSILISVALLSGDVFRVSAAQALAAAVPLVLLTSRRLQWSVPRERGLITRSELIALLLLVLVTPIAVPRMSMLYMTNDAGVYSNRAIHHLHQGSLTGVIPARGELEGDLLEIFDQDNLQRYRRAGDGHYLSGTYEAAPPGGSRFVYQFYPGWPLLMAQWAGLFGLSRMFFAGLFAFSMAVLFMGFLLEARGLGLAVFTTTLALFVSSPLLIYFSRYTTSEALLLFLFLFVLHFFSRGGRGTSTLAALGLLTIVVTHVSTFLYAPLVLLVALHAFFAADRRAASFGIAAFSFLLAGIPLGLHFCRQYVLDIQHVCFGRLGVADPVSFGLTSVTIAYSAGLALSILALRRAQRGAAPLKVVEQWPGDAARPLRVAIRAAVAAIAVATIYQGYQLGWTERFEPTAGAWGAREAYAGAGWSALLHANLVSMVMATSLVGLPLVLVLAVRRGDRMCAARHRALLLAAVLLSMGIYTFMTFDTPFNYYASRYFIPVLVPSVMLLFGEALEAFDVRRTWIVILVSVGLVFNARADRVLYLHPGYTDELRFVQDVGRRVGDHRTLFIRNVENRNTLALELLTLPLLNLHGIRVINVVGRSDAPVDDLIARYAQQMDLRDAAIISRRLPPDGRSFETAHLVQRRLAQDIVYPNRPAREEHRTYYLFDLAFE